jgi:hypothetical protein
LHEAYVLTNLAAARLVEGGYPSARESVKAYTCWRRPKTEPLLRVVPTEN